MNEESKSSINLTPIFWLGVILVTLKALGWTDLAWFWVLAPFWIPITAFLATLLILAIIAGICWAIAAFAEWRIKRKGIKKNGE